MCWISVYSWCPLVLAVSFTYQAPASQGDTCTAPSLRASASFPTHSTLGNGSTVVEILPVGGMMATWNIWGAKMPRSRYADTVLSWEKWSRVFFLCLV